VTTFESILRALGRGRGTEASRHIPEDLSPKARRDVEKLITRAQRQLRLLERELQCGLLMRQGEASAPARLDQLAAALDFDRSAAHVRDAVRGAREIGGPQPYLVVPEILPVDVLTAAREAIPARVFFETMGDACDEIAVPFPLAPIVSMATWAFVSSLTRTALLEALVDRLRVSIEWPSPGGAVERRRSLAVLQERLVRWHGGRRTLERRHRLPCLVVMVNLGETAHHVEMRDGAGAAIDVVVPPGTAVAIAVAAGRQATVVESVPPPAEGCTYQIVIGSARRD
jgi:hypothetical protein